jgi:hypothetical protein
VNFISFFEITFFFKARYCVSDGSGNPTPFCVD